ncbi:hypothetical protein D030_3933B, partial [Vibrio parahaemolyticus AQ3810]
AVLFLHRVMYLFIGDAETTTNQFGTALRLSDGKKLR